MIERAKELQDKVLHLQTLSSRPSTSTLPKIEQPIQAGVETPFEPPPEGEQLFELTPGGKKKERDEELVAEEESEEMRRMKERRRDQTIQEQLHVDTVRTLMCM